MANTGSSKRTPIFDKLINPNRMNTLRQIWSQNKEEGFNLLFLQLVVVVEIQVHL